MLVGRTSRTAMTVVLAGVVTAGVLAVPSASADPEPTIDEVQRRVDDLHHQAEQAAERFNTLKAQMGDAKREMRALQADADAQADETEQLRAQVEGLVVAQLDQGSLGSAGQVLLADDPDDLLASLATLQSYSERSADLLTSYENSADELAVREQQAQAQLDEIAAAREQMADEKAAIDEKADEAEDLLAELEAEAAEQASRGESPTVAVNPGEPASGAAATAVETALAQVGDPYVYGAAGPDSFDCSGLTMYAWAAAGVGLPHSSGMQSQMGTPVSLSDLQPGDLVFYYSPVSHVGMYIGNGQLVHAPNPSRSVEVVPVSSMPIAWARRVG